MTDPTDASAGEAICPTPCDLDCDADCHEEHQVSYKRKHRPERCPGREPVSNERVEELFNLADEILRAPSGFEKSFVINELGQAVAELVGAVERSRAVEAKLRAENAFLREVNEERNAETAERELAELRATARDLIDENDQLRSELVKVGEELAEMREQHQPGPSLHAWHGPSGEYVHGDQGWIRAKVRRHGGTHVASETCTYQGEWQEVDDDEA